MTIEKAIENLRLFVVLPPNPNDQDTQNALKLGIEALKRVQAARKSHYWRFETLLPGETEE